jgi:hypothetical protein
MDSLPSYWTIPFGVIAGCLAIGRTARWLQLLRALSGKDDSAATTTEKPPRVVATALSTVAHPTPWLVVIGIGLGVRRLVDTQPISQEWKWFFLAFFLGPALLGTIIYFKARRIQRTRAKAVGEP